MLKDPGVEVFFAAAVVVVVVVVVQASFTLVHVPDGLDDVGFVDLVRYPEPCVRRGEPELREQGRGVGLLLRHLGSLV